MSKPKRTDPEVEVLYECESCGMPVADERRDEHNYKFHTPGVYRGTPWYGDDFSV